MMDKIQLDMGSIHYWPTKYKHRLYLKHKHHNKTRYVVLFKKNSMKRIYQQVLREFLLKIPLVDGSLSTPTDDPNLTGSQLLLPLHSKFRNIRIKNQLHSETKD